jgi:long-chain acyl-CoA synthetase
MAAREPFTIQALVGTLPRFGDRRAVGLREELGTRWWSYTRLHDAAHRAAALLAAAGIGKGDRIAIRGRNSPEWVAFFFGAALRAAVVVPIDSDTPAELTRRIVAASAAKLLVLPDAEDKGDETIPTLGLNALYAPAAASPPADLVIACQPTDPLVIFFTSGTTSEPRGVVLTHANVVAQIARFRRWRFLTRWVGWRIVVMAPLSHAQGFVLGIGVPFSLGLSVIYTHAFHPAHLLRLLRDQRVPILSTVPRVLHLLGAELRSQQYGRGPYTLGQKLQRARWWIQRRHYVFTHIRRVVGYSGLWVVFVGGAPLPRADEEFWRVSGCVVIQGYGLTETTAIVSVNAPLLGAFGSVGKPFPDQEIRLAADGEILVRGANVMESYLGERESAGFDDGFFRTGDIGRLDSRNRLFVVGRKKEVIVTAEGFNVHGADVEAVLNAMPGVEDSVVIGLERDRQTEVHAALLLHAGADAAAAVASANRQLLPYQRVRGWTVWPERDFPRSAILKPRRQAIADRIAAAPESGGSGDGGRDSAPRSLDEIVAIEDRPQRIAAIARYISEGDARDASGAASLSLVQELGLSSLDMIELLALMEQQTGRMLDGAIDDDVSVASLQAMLRDPAATRRFGAMFERDPPRWAALSILQPFRSVLNPAVIDTYVRLRSRLTVTGLENLDGLQLPAVFAGGGHEHGFDVLLVYSALPRSLRKRMAIVTHRWIFTDALEVRPDVSAGHRLLAKAGFHVLVPLFFPFVMSSQYTRSRDSLMEACRLLDRGYSLIAFGGKGLGVVARQSGAPLVPVRIGNTQRADFRFRSRRTDTSIHFDRPILSRPGTPESEVMAVLEELYANDSI